jgi:hypothetical protein
MSKIQFIPPRGHVASVIISTLRQCEEKIAVFLFCAVREPNCIVRAEYKSEKCDHQLRHVPSAATAVTRTLHNVTLYVPCPFGLILYLVAVNVTIVFKVLTQCFRRQNIN